MKALLSVQSGGPESLVIRDCPTPVPGPGQIRIRVQACGINYPDVLIIEDRYQYKPQRPFSPGAEVAGVVDAIGAGVTRFKPGDRVLGGAGWGGLAELVVMEAARCFRVPDAMPIDEAAALLMTYGTSHYALKTRAALRKDETLLVLGAAGGVGLAAVDLGKAIGARVIGAVSSDEKAAVVRERGADATIVYPREAMDKAASKAFSDQIRERAGGGVDVIYDAVGGQYAEPALRAINWEGRYLVVGFTAGIPSIPLNLALLKSCQIVGVFWGASIERSLPAHEEQIAELFELYEQGLLHPLVSARYRFADAGQAIAHLGSRAAVGKVVVLMDEAS